MRSPARRPASLEVAALIVRMDSGHRVDVRGESARMRTDHLLPSAQPSRPVAVKGGLFALDLDSV